jgi:hypothetical protein
MFLKFFCQTGIAFINGKNKRDKWETCLFIPIFLFSIAKLILDYILEFDFRSTALAGPYVLFFCWTLGTLMWRKEGKDEYSQYFVRGKKKRRNYPSRSALDYTKSSYFSIVFSDAQSSGLRTRSATFKTAWNASVGIVA